MKHLARDVFDSFTKHSGCRPTGRDLAHWYILTLVIILLSNLVDMLTVNLVLDGYVFCDTPAVVVLVLAVVVMLVLVLVVVVAVVLAVVVVLLVLVLVVVVLMVLVVVLLLLLVVVAVHFHVAEDLDALGSLCHSEELGSFFNRIQF